MSKLFNILRKRHKQHKSNEHLNDSDNMGQQKKNKRHKQRPKSLYEIDYKNGQRASNSNISPIFITKKIINTKLPNEEYSDSDIEDNKSREMFDIKKYQQNKQLDDHIVAHNITENNNIKPGIPEINDTRYDDDDDDIGDLMDEAFLDLEGNCVDINSTVDSTSTYTLVPGNSISLNSSQESNITIIESELSDSFSNYKSDEYASQLEFSDSFCMLNKDFDNSVCQNKELLTGNNERDSTLSLDKLDEAEETSENSVDTDIEEQKIIYTVKPEGEFIEIETTQSNSLSDISKCIASTEDLYNNYPSGDECIGSVQSKIDLIEQKETSQPDSLNYINFSILKDDSNRLLKNVISNYVNDLISNACRIVNDSSSSHLKPLNESFDYSTVDLNQTSDSNESEITLIRKNSDSNESFYKSLDPINNLNNTVSHTESQQTENGAFEKGDEAIEKDKSEYVQPMIDTSNASSKNDQNTKLEFKNSCSSDGSSNSLSETSHSETGITNNTSSNSSLNLEESQLVDNTYLREFESNYHMPDENHKNEDQCESNDNTNTENLGEFESNYHIPEENHKNEYQCESNDNTNTENSREFEFNYHIPDENHENDYQCESNDNTNTEDLREFETNYHIPDGNPKYEDQSETNDNANTEDLREFETLPRVPDEIHKNVDQYTDNDNLNSEFNDIYDSEGDAIDQRNENLTCEINNVQMPEITVDSGRNSNSNCIENLFLTELKDNEKPDIQNTETDKDNKHVNQNESGSEENANASEETSEIDLSEDLQLNSVSDSCNKKLDYSSSGKDIGSSVFSESEDVTTDTEDNSLWVSASGDDALLSHVLLTQNSTEISESYRTPLVCSPEPYTNADTEAKHYSIDNNNDYENKSDVAIPGTINNVILKLSTGAKESIETETHVDSKEAIEINKNVCDNFASINSKCCDQVVCKNDSVNNNKQVPENSTKKNSIEPAFNLQSTDSKIKNKTPNRTKGSRNILESNANKQLLLPQKDKTHLKRIRVNKIVDNKPYQLTLNTDTKGADHKHVAESRELRLRGLRRKDDGLASEDVSVLSSNDSDIHNGRDMSPSTGGRYSSRRSSDSMYFDDIPDPSELRESMKVVEDKLRKAMVSNVKLDNEKSTLTYEVEALKDKYTDLEETHNQLLIEHKKKYLENERFRKVSNKLKEEIKQVRNLLQERDALIQEYGLIVVGETDAEWVEDADNCTNKANDDDTLLDLSPRKIGIKKVLLSQEAAKLLEGGAAAESLDVRLKKFMAEKMVLEDQLTKLRIQLDEESLKNKQLDGLDVDKQKEISKNLHEYKQRVQKAEAEVASLQATVIRLEALVMRFKASSEELEKNEEDLKAEKRRLQRELRDALQLCEDHENDKIYLKRQCEKLSRKN